MSKTHTRLPRRKADIQPLLVDMYEAAVMLGIGQGKLKEMMRNGEVDVVAIGRASTRITVASLQRWAAKLPRRGPDHGPTNRFERTQGDAA
jgi:hypothetical protein